MTANLLLVLAVLSAIALAATAGQGPVAMAAAFAAVLFVMLAAWTSNFGITAMDSSGIKVRRGALPGRSVTWEEVQSIHVHTRDVGFGAVSTIKVETVHGRAFRLPGLEHSMRRTDSAFDAKYQQVLDLWERHA